MAIKREVVLKGHIVDSGTMSKALDEIIVHHGRFKILEFKIGQTNTDLSTARISYSANSDADLEMITDRLLDLGGSIPSEPDLRTATAKKAQSVAADFYSTTNHRTEVRIGEKWKVVGNQRMDAVIVIQGSKPVCTKLRDVKRGDRIVCGHSGIRVTPEFKNRAREDFAFMSNEVSSERKVELGVGYVNGACRSVDEPGVGDDGH